MMFLPYINMNWPYIYTCPLHSYALHGTSLPCKAILYVSFMVQNSVSPSKAMG